MTGQFFPRAASVRSRLSRLAGVSAAVLFLAPLLNMGVAHPMQIDFQYLDIPVFRTGETGPLLGRVVVRLPLGEDALTARAGIRLEGAEEEFQGAETLLYPGVSTSLDFPISLERSQSQNSVIAARLTVRLGQNVALTRPVHVMVREYGMYYRTYRSRLDDAVYPYALYLPRGYDTPDRKWPLVVSLHGAYSNHANNMRRLFGIGNRPGEPDEMVFSSMPIWPELPDMPGIVVCPWGRGTMSYHGPGARDVLDVLEIVRAEYSTDQERTSITGLSMGGNGTWEFTLRYPGEWAASYPVCPVADLKLWGAITRILPEDLDGKPWIKDAIERNQISNRALNARGIKVHVFHGNDDPVVTIAHSEQMVDALKAVGVRAPFTRFDNVGHNAWDPAYEGGRSLMELFESRRERPFREIDFTTCRYADARYGWLEVAEFAEYGPYAVVKASWHPERRTVSLREAENVALLRLDTRELFDGMPGEVTLSYRGSTVRLKPGGDGFATAALARGRLGAAEVPADEPPRKRKDLEGPLYDALSDRVILVYGTKDGGTGTRDQALKFAWWGELPDLHFMVRPDTAISEKDIAESHLVLFGDEKSNRIIARINDRFPVRFQGGRVTAGNESWPREDVAFKCVYPNPLNPKRLVLLNYADQWEYAGGLMSFVGFKLIPDYYVHRRGSNQPYGAEVLKAGYFDKKWQW